MQVSKKTFMLLLLVFGTAIHQVWAFCGFYVAKAGAELFNNKSQVIIVRDGNKNVITMANDFKGDAKDFAMVVPVPVVLKKEDIKVVYKTLFDKLDAYSAPRMVEYYDENPCEPRVYKMERAMANVMTDSDMAAPMEAEVKKDYKVTIEAKYSVEEYDILILSAKESSGLKNWLTDNGYSIPAKAEEVLDPYIKSNLKFFVVKVNMEKMKGLTDGYLRPLQIRFEHEKFMLPIRLGMANANGEQDMIVYAFTKNGRVETTNYRTVKVPSDRNIPMYVQQRFDKFYGDLFTKSYKREEKNAVFVEYAWNLSPYNYLKCDPCVGEVPDYSDMITAGVDWLKSGNGINNSASVFFTRLHVRYTRDKFPQDLMFMETPNMENFQGRYIITHPAKGDLKCDEGQKYLTDLRNRRQRENMELAALTGWNVNKYAYYVEEFDDLIKNKKDIPVKQDPTIDTVPAEEEYTVPAVFDGPGSGNNNRPNSKWGLIFYISLGVLLLLSAFNLWQVLTRGQKRHAV